MFRDGLMAEKPLPRGELLAAMILFVLPLLMSILAASTISLPQWTEPVFLCCPVIWERCFSHWDLAVIRGVPGWSLPYVGFALMLGLIVVRFRWHLDMDLPRFHPVVWGAVHVAAGGANALWGGFFLYYIIFGSVERDHCG